MTPEVDSFPGATELANLTTRLNAVTKAFRESMTEYMEAVPAKREAMQPLMEQLRESKSKLRDEIDAIVFGEDA